MTTLVRMRANLTRLLSFVVLSAALATSACQTITDRAEAVLTGSFSSETQAELDPTYFDIRLEMRPIWTARGDGPWLYVEQAAASALDRPYRQRVYHLVRTPLGVRSDVYSLPGDPLEFAGGFRDPACFDAIGPDDLTIRTGCAIHLAEIAESFVGATFEKDCESSLRGASYATSEVVLTHDLLTTWDRGFDADDQQVWGATEGPYEFVRVGD